MATTALLMFFFLLGFQRANAIFVDPVSGVDDLLCGSSLFPCRTLRRGRLLFLSCDCIHLLVLFPMMQSVFIELTMNVFAGIQNTNETDKIVILRPGLYLGECGTLGWSVFLLCHLGEPLQLIES
jgi:hypothetical protein